MLRKGGVLDLARAAEWFVRWWREDGGLIAAAQAPAPDSVSMDPLTRRGWGFDLEWSVDDRTTDRVGNALVVQRKMEEVIDEYLGNIDVEESEVSSTQEKKRYKEEMMAKRATKAKARGAARRMG